MADEMFADDQSFTDLLDACAQNVGKRPRVATDGTQRPGKGPAARFSPSSASTLSGGNDDLLRMLARLTLRQEDAISQLQLDKSFMFFIQCGRGSIMPTLLTQAKEWNQLKEKGEATMPLRMHMFLQCFQLLAQRAQLLKLDASDDALVLNLRSKGILTEDSKWAYLSWDSQAMILKPNRMPPLTSEEIRSLLERIAHLGQQPGVIHKFSALRPVKQDTLPQDATTAIPWRLDLSLRSPEASELFQLLQKLAGNGITQLILLRVRGANLQRSPLANAISQRLRRS